MQRMQRRGQMVKYNNILYNDDTEPGMPTVTAPLPERFILRESGSRRFFRGVGDFFVAVIRKFNQLLSLALAVVLLLLVGRFLLTLFGLKTSLFAQLIFFLGAPLTIPFDNFLPITSYNGFLIDGSILVAMLVYILLRILISRLLKIVTN